MAREAIFTSQGIPLKTQVAKASRIAVIVDDKTRPTPAKEILGVLLPELSKWGHPKEDTIIVMALGTHVPMDAREIEEKLGKRVAEEYTVVQHSAWQDDLVGHGSENKPRGGAGGSEDRLELHPASPDGRLRRGTKDIDARSL